MWDKIGIRVPDTLGDIIDTMSETVEEDGMIFDIYEDGTVGAYHDAVGLVTFYRFPDVDSAYAAIAERA